MHRSLSYAARWGLQGLLSGLLSCALASARLLYVAREQKTYDHMIWPGVVFALVVVFPIARSARDGWPRTVAAFVASCGVYPIAWHIAAPTTAHPGVYMVAAFALSGLVGSCALAVALLFARPGWARAAGATVAAGVAVGGLMGVHLLVTLTGRIAFGSVELVMGLYLVLWQAAVGLALARGVLPKHD